MLHIGLREGRQIFIGHSLRVTLSAIQRTSPKSAEIVVDARPGLRRSAVVMQVEQEKELEGDVVLKMLRIRARDVLIGIRADPRVLIFRDERCPADVKRMWGAEAET